jgi:glycosyltransferase involved in cell wall biosynthesis
MIKISYIVSTKNRLEFIKIIEEHIFSNLNADEELIIIDGNSTDGSKEYLQELYDKGIIHQFISEPDANQAHGWNKAMLLAKGKFIKKIIDDDVFDISIIRKCALWMDKHPQVDFCISDTLQTHLANPKDISKAGRKEAFFKWRKKETKSFTFSDVYLLIRKNSLSRFGLFDTQFRMLDWEYSLRVSYLRASIAYCNSCMSLTVGTPGNVTSTSSKSILLREEEIGKVKYEYPGDRAEISNYSKLKIFIGKNLGRLKQRKAINQTFLPKDISPIYMELYQHLHAYNNSKNFEVTYE